MSLPVSNRLLSKDMRGRTVNGVPGGASVSPGGLGRPKRGRSLWRCCKVDRRREDERLGMVAYGPTFWRGLGLNGASLANGLAGAFSASLSKMLKSGEKLGVCTLRRLAEGLPREAWSKFIIPSLRFKGLTAA